MITDKFIRSKAKNEMTYRAGVQLFMQELVEAATFETIDINTEHGAVSPNNTHPVKSINSHNVSRQTPKTASAKKGKDEPSLQFRCSCTVMETTKNKVVIQATENCEDISYSCSCPSYWATWGACKHIIAALKYVSPIWEEKTKEAFTHNKSLENQKFFESIQKVLSEGAPEHEGKISVHLWPTLRCETDRDGQISIRLEICIGKEKQYLVKELRTFLNQLEDRKKIEFSKLFVYDPDKMSFDYKSKQLVLLLNSYYLDENRLSQAMEYNSKSNFPRISLFDGREFKVGSSALSSFCDIYQDDEIEVQYQKEKPKMMTISNALFPTYNANQENGFGFSLTKYWKDHAQFQVKGEMAYPISIDCKYVIYKNTLYIIDSKHAKLLKPLLEHFIITKNKPLIIASEVLEKFYTEILIPLDYQIGVYVESAISSRIQIIKMKCIVKIDQEKNTLIARVEFLYENKDESKICVFDQSGEKEVLRILEKYGFMSLGQIDANIFACSKDESIYQFLVKGIPKLSNISTILYSDEFKTLKKINKSMLPQISFGLEGDLLEVSFEFEELSYLELQECIKSYKLKKHYYRLKNGEFLNLDSKEFKEFTEVIDGIGLKEKDIKMQSVFLPNYRTMYIDQLSDSFDTIKINKKETFVDLLNQMKNNDSEEMAVPKNLQSVLREYQKLGVLWLYRLHKFKFGGILADDMGLGKTLQVLSFLVNEKNNENTNMPSLVVAPTSLVYNWEAEVLKFAPQIKTLLIHGSVSERDEKLSRIKEADLVITSYALLRRDIEKYQSVIFRACIIDEAQNIKNPKTINSKSVKQVHAQTYFALTGTPIENSLTELWSIFDFLMPGYLFTHAKFQEQFEIPIFKDKDTAAISRLKRLVSPFILRRMKKDVLKELPEKINSVVYNEMTPEQAKIYASYVLSTKAEVQRLIGESPDLKSSRFEILSLITRLRQLCCHPSLFIEDYEGESGKLDQAMELIEDAISGQHRILIFSQFTSMLEKVRSKLDHLNIEYFYLDGKTPTKERKTSIDSFQSGEKSLFLLSLKAGGTGLNLTGADMVIHLDPWWNPAVEDQATDRAYRIGQTNPVQVFKLITKNSIEEKIFALQEKKNAFVSEMTSFNEESPIFSLDKDDLLSLFND